MTRDKEKIPLTLLPLTGASTPTDTNALERSPFTAVLLDSKVKLRLWPPPPQWSRGHGSRADLGIRKEERMGHIYTSGQGEAQLLLAG